MPRHPAPVVWLENVKAGCVSLDVPVGEHPQTTTLGELLEDTEAPTVEQIVERRALGAALAPILDRLAPRQALIMRLRYGLDGRGQRTHSQIADRVGLTRQWVRSLERDSLARLREDPDLGLLAG